MTIFVDIHKQLTSGRRNFNLDVHFSSKDQWTVLFGPSGSGKTMTLKALAGLMEPDDGRIQIDDHTWFDRERRINFPVRRRRVGYLFQDYALFPHMTVTANIGFGLFPNRPWRFCRSGQHRVNLILEMLDLKSLADCYPENLSGGQRQRVALGRALISKPSLLLLDEPFAALDPMLRRRLRTELKSILSRFAIPVVMITHDPEDISEFAQTLVIYANGRVCDQLTGYENKKSKLRWYYESTWSGEKPIGKGCQDPQCTTHRYGRDGESAKRAVYH